MTARRIFTTALGAGVAGAALAAIQLLPAAELILNSSRTEFNSPTARAFALPPWQQVVWLFPDFFGNPARSSYWGEGNFFEATPYVGTATLLLAGAGILFCNHRIKPLLLALALAGVLLGMGYYAPFYPAAAKLLPFLKMMRGAGRWLILPVFSACVFAALGWDALVTEAAAMNRFFRWTKVIAAVVFALGVMLVFSDPFARTAQPVIARILERTHKDVDPALLAPFTQAVAARAGLSVFTSLLWIALFALVVSIGARGRSSHPAFGALAVTAVYADLFWFGASFNPTATADVFSLPPPTVAAVDPRIATPQRYIKNLWNDYVSYQQFVVPLHKGGRSPVLTTESAAFAAPLRFQLPATNMVTKTLNAEGYDPLRLRSFDRKLRTIEAGDDVRAWRDLSVRWVLERSPQDSDQAFWREIPDWLPRAQLLARGREEAKPLALTDRANAVVAECNDGGALLVRDVWYPGWQAYQRGERVRMECSADGFRRLTVVKKGSVKLVFVVESLLVGAALSMLTTAVLLGAGSSMMISQSVRKS